MSLMYCVACGKKTASKSIKKSVKKKHCMLRAVCVKCGNKKCQFVKSSKCPSLKKSRRKSHRRHKKSHKKSRRHR